MKKIKIVLITLLSFSLVSFGGMAANVEINWVEPENYKDVRPGNHGSKKKFEEQVFYTLEKHFTKMAEQLPEGQLLTVNVTDIDLAGDTMIGGINQYRVIKGVYHPRIEFSYQLVDDKGVSRYNGEINLKDRHFKSGSTGRYKNDFLSYEKLMLDKWFKKTFVESLTTK